MPQQQGPGFLYESAQEKENAKPLWYKKASTVVAFLVALLFAWYVPDFYIARNVTFMMPSQAVAGQGASVYDALQSTEGVAVSTSTATTTPVKRLASLFATSTVVVRAVEVGAAVPAEVSISVPAAAPAPVASQTVSTTTALRATTTPGSTLTPVQSPGYGSGGGGTVPDTVSKAAVSVVAEATTTTTSGSPAITLPTLASTTVFIASTTRILFAGTGTVGLLVYVSDGTTTATTSIGVDGGWRLPLIFSEGTTTVQVVYVNRAGTSTPDYRTVVVDTTGPGVQKYALEQCEKFSLVTWGCVLATTTISIDSLSAEGAVRFELLVNGVVVSSTTAEGGTLKGLLPDEATSTIAITAYDSAGNATTSPATSAAVFTVPLVISEVMWAGEYLPADEHGGAGDLRGQYIEITNRAPFTLALFSETRAVRLHNYAIEGSIPNLRMVIPSGVVLAPYQSYLIEQSQHTTSVQGALLPVSIHEIDQLTLSLTHACAAGDEESGRACNADGEDVVVLDTTPPLQACAPLGVESARWCEGIDTATYAALNSQERALLDTLGVRTPASMERKVGARNGALPESWYTQKYYNDLASRYTIDYDPGADKVFGTPGSWGLVGMRLVDDVNVPYTTRAVTLRNETGVPQTVYAVASAFAPGTQRTYALVVLRAGVPTVEATVVGTTDEEVRMTLPGLEEGDQWHIDVWEESAAATGMLDFLNAVTTLVPPVFRKTLQLFTQGAPFILE
jgi:hypothetical protein